MKFTVINNPNHTAHNGFTNAQFKRLDGLYLKSAGQGVLTYRTVDCDFDAGIARYTYYQSQDMAPFLQFIIRKVGPNNIMYEVYQHGKGRIAKSGVFDRAFDVLRDHIENL